MEAVRDILKYCSPGSYVKGVRDTSILFFLPESVKDSLFNDPGYREGMINLYQMTVKPEVERLKRYEWQLNMLTNGFVSNISDKDLQEFSALYRTYRTLNDTDKQYFLLAVDKKYAPLIKAIDHFDRTYRDILVNDVAVACDRLSDEFGLDDGIRKHDYGPLFPYLHLAKSLNSMLETKMGSNHYN